MPCSPRSAKRTASVAPSRSPAWPALTRSSTSPARRAGGKQAKSGSPHLRWALVEAAVHANPHRAPDVALYRATGVRRDATVARLTVARKIGKRVYLALRKLEPAAA